MTPKKLFLLTILFILLVGAYVFVTRNEGDIFTGRSRIEILPSTTPTPSFSLTSPSPQSVRLPSFVTNESSTVQFLPPPSFPSVTTVTNYTVVQPTLVTYGTTLARTLGVQKNLDQVAGTPIHWIAIDGQKQFDITEFPYSFSFTDRISLQVPQKYLSFEEAEKRARKFIEDHGLTPSTVSLVVSEKSYQNTNGSVFSPVTNITDPIVVSLIFSYFIESHPVYIQTGEPASIRVVISDQGIHRVSGDIISLQNNGTSLVISAQSAFEQLLAGRGSLIFVGGDDREEREGTKRSVSLEKVRIINQTIGYYLYDSSRFLPVYVFEGKGLDKESFDVRYIVPAK